MYFIKDFVIIFKEHVYFLIEYKTLFFKGDGVFYQILTEKLIIIRNSFEIRTEGIHNVRFCRFRLVAFFIQDSFTEISKPVICFLKIYSLFKPVILFGCDQFIAVLTHRENKKK